METAEDGEELGSWAMMLGISLITFFLGEQSQNKRINTCSCFRCTVESWPRLGKAPRFVFPLRRRTGLKPYYKIHLENVLGKLEKSLINSIL